MYRLWCLVLVILTILLLFGPVQAASLDGCLCRAWVRTEGSPWGPATAHPALRPGEEFSVMVLVATTRPAAWVFLSLREFGTPVYDVVTGPSGIEEPLLCGRHVHPPFLKAFVWKVRVLPDTAWVNGIAPLDVFAQFSSPSAKVTVLSFSVVCGAISSQ